MRARDVIGRRIVDVRQERVPTRWTHDSRGGVVERESAWAVIALILDNGSRIVLHARETDDSPIVTTTVVK